MASMRATAQPAKFRAQPGIQSWAIACPVFEALFWGDRGGAKTFTGHFIFGKEVGKGYGVKWRGIWTRREFDDLKDAIDKSRLIFKHFEGARFYESAADYFWEFKDGERLMFRGMKRHRDIDSWQGAEIPFQMHDELTQHADDYIFVNMMACCRATGAPPSMPRIFRGACNSMGPGHNWVKNRYQLPYMNNKVLTGLVDDHGEPLPDRVAIEMPRSQNKIMLRDDPHYVSRIRAAAQGDPNKYRSWVLGGSAAWEITSGGMFDDIWLTHRDAILVEPFDVPADWKINRSYDWGGTKPFAVLWWAESDGTDLKLRNGRTRSTVRGDLFLIAEWYGWTGKANEGLRLLNEQISKGIIEREMAMGLYGRVKPGPADTMIFDADPGKTSIAVDMAKPVRMDDGRILPGVEWTRDADKDAGSRVRGWQLMRTMFASTKAELGRARENPGLFIVNHCHQFLRTVPTLSRKEGKEDDVDTDLEDHIADATRYRIRTKSAPPVRAKRTGIV